MACAAAAVVLAGDADGGAAHGVAEGSGVAVEDPHTNADTAVMTQKSKEGLELPATAPEA